MMTVVVMCYGGNRSARYSRRRTGRSRQLSGRRLTRTIIIGRVKLSQGERDYFPARGRGDLGAESSGAESYS
jgi:hypothetical protein